ncbi:MAG: response regulator [Desulfobacterales bacterium]|nr:response regulator [Desulfobacterales bacterium]
MTECCILITDDDLDWVKRVQKKLRAKYPLTQVATEVEAALQCIEKGLFDVIFCDIKMKYHDKSGVLRDDGGFQIANSARALIPGVKVVMVTAYGSNSYVRQSFRQGAFDYLEKSIEGTKHDVSAMVEIIEKILREKEKTPIAPNPFVIEEGKLPKYFLPRRTDQPSALDHNTFIAELFKDTFDRHAPRSFLILGAAGTGKTSLFKHYKNFIQKKGSLVSYFNMSEARELVSPREMVSSVLFGIVKGFSKYEVSYFKRFVSNLEKFGLKVGPISFTIKPQESELDISTLIREGLVGISQDLERSSDVIGLFIDNLQNIEKCPEILELMLNILSSTALSKMPIIFGISCLTDAWSLLTRNESLALTRRAFVRNAVTLSNFSEDETTELIVNTLFNSGVTFTPEVIKEIFSHTAGHPFKLQLLCSNLYENQISGTVDIGVFSKALNKTLEDMKIYEFRLVDQLSERETTVLRILANAETPITRKELDIQLLEIERRDLIIESQDILEELQEKDVVSVHEATGTDAARYYIGDKMLQEYVRRKRMRVGKG